MIRGIFRVICLLLLVTIFVNIKKSKCFNMSLTFKYPKQLGVQQYGEAVYNKFRILKKSIQEYPAIVSVGCREVCGRVKPFIHTTYLWVAFVIRNTCLFVQEIRNYLAKNPPRTTAKSFIPKTLEE